MKEVGKMKKATAVLALTILTAVSAWAQEAGDVQQIAVPLSDPGKPVILHASLLSGRISVEAHDSPEVLIEIVPEQARETTESSRGMHRIPNTSLGLTVEENDNTVEARGNWASKIYQLRIKVPVETSVYLSSTNNSSLAVDGVRGEVELKSTNGPISATNIDGSVIAHTTNGSVKVSFHAIRPEKAMSFVTLNGDVDVSFPAGLRADLRINAGQGDIYTDFEFELVPQQPQVEDESEGGRYRVRLEKEVRATVGGGGPEMHFKTWHGDVFVRRSGG
jgi:DUF4097 and DUF4098 domain-containing protein YvlB